MCFSCETGKHVTEVQLLLPKYFTADSLVLLLKRRDKQAQKSRFAV